MEEIKINNNTKKIKLVNNFQFPKIPPQAIDLEKVVLGGLLIDKTALEKIIEILSENIFYRKEHKIIFKTICNLFNNNEPIDIYTVSNQLRKDGMFNESGGDIYLIELSQLVSSTAHIEYYARIIQEKYILRRLINISSEIIEKAFDETVDVFDLLDKSENQLFTIANNTLKKNFETSQNLVKEAIKKIEKLNKNQGISGLSSGFLSIDKVTSGWQNSDLIIIAGRPGMGKTAFILSMVKNIAINNQQPVGIFSLEMQNIQLIMRLITIETGISSEVFKKNNLENKEWEKFYLKSKKIENSPIYIDDQPALSIFDFRSKARRLVSHFGVKILIVDYLQLMNSGINTNNREQEISIISRGLKSIAKELNIPIIALSQLSRQVESRSGHKRPQLSDLRDSGAIEQDADIVSFIYRPEYYNLEFWDNASNDPTYDQAEFIIAKNRNGSLHNIRIQFISNQAKFMDLYNNFT